MKLDTYMKANSLDAISLAAEIGVGAEAVRTWLRGERIPRADQMRRIVEITGGAVTANDFYAPEHVP
jgi:transcriptional regulator with XRE-family HTH domain